MRKHHNKLFYGKYTHKTTFNFPWAHKLYPTTDENLINFIKDYEQDNFGEVSTDLSDPERVVNMYVYIIGEEIVWEYLAKLEEVA